ncbi:HIT family protein [Candidatus Woesearchaeota archaeon CG10_big_fil_rev_8_21_14_0_10_37_12]|nr:MAG: HIT family protein [Candidatus Woesearchaeota archaeon CG10_big_fil_rev_8_21_14_0_10_37_12]
MTDCQFCNFIEQKTNVLFSDESVVVMLSPQPVAGGHLLVLPKKHAPIIEVVPDDVVGRLFSAANKAGVAVFEALGAQGTNILVQNGPSAGQVYNHVLLHVIPRFEGDSVELLWTPKQASEDELSQIAEKLTQKETVNVEKKKDASDDVSEDDLRVKHLLRIP